MHPFRIVMIDAVMQGGTRVQWDLDWSFNDPYPYQFQLQYSFGGDVNADDWTDVGSPVINQFYAIDPVKRMYGKTLDVYYRVVLATPVGVYISGGTSVTSWMHRHQWRIAREVIRKEQLRHRMFASIQGYLLVRRRYGMPCTDCLDPNTGEIINASNCLSCFGTGIMGGYFDAIPGYYADVSLRKRREHQDVQLRGTVNDLVQEARFLGYPRLRSYDAWANLHSDERYYIHEISDAARIGNAPIVQTAELRLAPFTDLLYQVPV